ncbi:MAG: ADP-ribosylglycohydrolase family protein [Actinobacteria bacterium]|nr:ADP-ribosylglycohydrolase family protein [Actinomycetota bacterium]
MATEKLEALVDRVAASTPEDLKDRYRGVLLGVAAGNALGLPVEGRSRRAVERAYPGGVREVDVAERDRPWDDDLAQTVIVAEALLEERFTTGDLAARFVEWGRSNGRGMGHLTSEVLHELGRGTPPPDAARAVYERMGGTSSAGNGAVMRCAPVALRWRKSGASLIDAARASALVTHYDPLCEWSTVVMAVCVAIALAGQDVSHDELADAVDASEAPSEVGEAIRFVPGRGLRDLELDDPMDMGYTLNAMQVGLWSFTKALDFADTLVQVVDEGGDTDSNGAVAGAIMGARVGASRIPPHWLANVPDTDRLTELADGLYARGNSAA